MDARDCAKKSRNENNQGPPTSLLSVEYKSERALWQLSLVLAEIANQERLRQSAKSQNDTQRHGDE